MMMIGVLGRVDCKDHFARTEGGTALSPTRNDLQGEWSMLDVGVTKFPAHRWQTVSSLEVLDWNLSEARARISSHLI